MSTEPSKSKERRRLPLETTRALVLAIALALTIRAFVIEPFKIPSGSMIPTLLVGDYLVVSKFIYGVRMPFTGSLIFPVGEVKRGDVVVFRYPDDRSTDFIKRVIGLPGDKIEVRADRLWVNEQVMDRVEEEEFSFFDYSQGRQVRAKGFREMNPEGVEYTIIHRLRMPRRGSRSQWIVPDDHYFMMGDNRDNSRDSRMWTNPFVPAEDIKGKALMIHWSWVISSGPVADRGFIADLLYTVYRVVTFQVEKVRWGRIGRGIDGVAY